MSAAPRHREEPPAYEGEFTAELPPAWVSLSLGGLALAFAALGQLGPTRAVVSWADLPLTLLLFCADAYLTLGSEQRARGGLLGLALAGLAVAIAAAGLMLRRDHPWLG